MSSTFIEHSPKADDDKSLILIMDKDGNVTADSAHFEKLITNQKLPDVGIKIVRLDSSLCENDDSKESDKSELKLTVEEIYPETLPLAPGEPLANVMSSSSDTLPGPSNEHLNHDIVDPFSQMDPEQLQRLEHALASEQAKQILGENVAAMFDMLTVEDSPAAFLQNTIKNDHCYTNLLPSSDPNGPSFFMNDNRSDIAKGKGKAKVGTPIKGRKILSTEVGTAAGNTVRKAIVKDMKPVVKSHQATMLDYARALPTSQPNFQNKMNIDSSVEEGVDVEDSDASVDVDDDNLSDEDYNNRSTKTKRKPRKYKKRIPGRGGGPGRGLGRGIVKPGVRFGKRSTLTPEIKARNEKLDEAMSKIVESVAFNSTESDLKKSIKKAFKTKFDKNDPIIEKEKVAKEVPKPEEPSISSGKTQSAKYPKRENRKPPAHLADAFGPALFSSPDIIRRVSTNEEFSPVTPEKKNFTVGVHSSVKSGERAVVKASSTPTTPVPNESQSKPRPKLPPKETKVVSNETEKEKPESQEEKPVIEDEESGSESKKSNLDIQKLMEKHQIKTPLYEEDQDYSDENIDENYYLDPTQMDQSLLEGFGSAVAKSEDQLLQEAILLQEELIEANKGIGVSEPVNSGLEDNQVQIPFDTETIEDIQNEITSAILIAHEGGETEEKRNFQFDEDTVKSVFMSNSASLNMKKENRVTGNSSDNEVPSFEEGNLVVDENKTEDRKRNSVKRRRSDEVSDLDSDLDDALSEASWNSEDDPDRLWCICRKPHNNRFMICCDVCEEWFHGKCVGVTKTIGKQMEQDGLEWSCPNCTKKKKVEEHDREAEKIKQLKEKMAQSIKEQQQKIKESQKLKNQAQVTKDKNLKLSKSVVSGLKQTKISDFSQFSSNQGSEEEETVGRKCIMCKGPVRENSIYCSDECIRKHSQHAISQLMGDSNKKVESEPVSETNRDNSRIAQKIRKEDSRIVVMDPNSKKFLVGQNAPTAANLTTWLKENPSYHVVYKKSDKPGKILLTSRKVVKIQSKPGETQKVFVQKVGDSIKSTQLKLAVSPNSKQLNILQPSVSASGKKVYQIVNSIGPGGKQTSFVVKPKTPEIIESLPLPVKTVLSQGVTLKVKEAPKVTQVSAVKDSGSQKPEKIQKKRKERTSKSAASAVPGKDSKMGQKPDEGKEKEKKEADQQIRDSVKKTLAETLKARIQECKDMDYNEEAIDSLALKIEEKLFKHFENKVDTKYKSKYRSLVFNIKDPKNETLYKKILDNSISPKELVKLSPEELASQELARWREKENQHQLEMIKKTELELMTKGNTYIMKSHKGEQVIENDQSEKVAAVAAEIDPNTPAQELVSALNSVTSTTQDIVEDDDKSKGNLETSLMKIKKKEKERRRSRDRKHDRRDRERRRSSSRSSHSRSHRSKNKKRSRSRDKDKDKEKEKEKEKDKAKYKHKDKKPEKKKEKDDKEEHGNKKSEEKTCKGEISTSEDVEIKTIKKTVEDEDADREPSSTVTIKTPDVNMEDPEPTPLWKGSIVMADVAKFCGVATELSGDCAGLSYDIGEKVDVVGRIPFDTVWDYIARMKKMGTKDILVIKIVPLLEEEKTAYATLYSYLLKRSRIGVIGKTSEAVKDFYLYPLASHSPIPQVLMPLDGPPLESDRDNIILGVIVRNKHRVRHLGIASSAQHQKTVRRPPAAEDEGGSLPDTVPDRSYTPPLPDKEHEMLLKKQRQKRRVRIRMDYKEIPATNEEEEEDQPREEDDSPYSPGDSDDEMPPLPKIGKPTHISNSISKLISPRVPMTDSNLQDPAEIQRKIEEMNRAIEEQTQQIQSLTSAVPKLAAGVPLPLLGNVASTILTPSALSPTNLALAGSVNPPPPVAAVAAMPSLSGSEKVQLPLISEPESSPPRSFTPPMKIEENIPFLPEVTSKISLPSNLQEILNSIQKKSGEPEVMTKEVSKPVEELIKTEDPDVKMALDVLNSTKSLLTSLSSAPSENEEADKNEKPSSETLPLLSRMTDEELLEKAKEMEMESCSEPAVMLPVNPCPPQPLPPGIQDIPLMPPIEPPYSNPPLMESSYVNPPPLEPPYANPPPPPSYFSKPPPPSLSTVVLPKTPPDSEDRKPEKKLKLDPKSVFENEGVPDFVNIPGSSWDDKKGQKAKGYKIDIKLAMNSLEKKSIDMDHFDIESISKISEVEDRQVPSVSGSFQKSSEESRYSDEDRLLPKAEEKFRSGHERDRRRSDEREIKRDWKYRRHWDEDKRYKDDYRRHGRRDRPKFRKDRFEHKVSRHLQKEWDGSIKNFEERQRWRNEEIRREEMRRSRKRAGSSSN